MGHLIEKNTKWLVIICVWRIFWGVRNCISGECGMVEYEFTAGFEKHIDPTAIFGDMGVTIFTITSYCMVWFSSFVYQTNCPKLCKNKVKYSYGGGARGAYLTHGLKPTGIVNHWQGKCSRFYLKYLLTGRIMFFDSFICTNRTIISSWVLASIILDTFHGALSLGVQYNGHNLFIIISILLIFK